MAGHGRAPGSGEGARVSGLWRMEAREPRGSVFMCLVRRPARSHARRPAEDTLAAGEEAGDRPCPPSDQLRRVLQAVWPQAYVV